MLSSEDLNMIDHIATLSKGARISDTRLKIYLLKLFNDLETKLTDFSSKVMLCKSVSDIMADIKKTLFNDMIATCNVKSLVKATYSSIWNQELSTWMSSKSIQACKDTYYYPHEYGQNYSW